MEKSVVAPAEFARVQHELTEAKQALETLYAALDNVDSGLLVLNKDLRAIYSNPVLHRMFKANSSKEIWENRPLYADMLASLRPGSSRQSRRLRRTTACVGPIRGSKANGFSHDGRNNDALSFGRIADGGRMLIYSDVTDIVRDAKELERLATTDGMTGHKTIAGTS